MSDTTMIPAGTAAPMSVADIQRHVSAALSQFASKADDAKDAREIANDASNAAVGERERLITNLAALSHTHGWDNDDIATAVKAALNARNAKNSTVATFASEIRGMCDRRVRRHVASWFALARSAYEAEGEAVRKTAKGTRADKPLRDCASRAYHFVVGAMRRGAVDDGVTFADASDLIAFARSELRKRELNVGSVHKRLQAICATLKAFNLDFPGVDGLPECLEYLGDIKEGDLRDALNRAKGLNATATDEPEVSEPASDDDASEPESMDDMLGGALADMHGVALAAA